MNKQQQKTLIRALYALLLIICAGGIAMQTARTGYRDDLAIFAFVVGLIAILFVPHLRRPQAVEFRPYNWVVYLLKWVSAPQIEATILLWFGISLLVQPEFSSVFDLSASYGFTYVLGWVFLLLAWRMAVELPSPMAYSLMTGFRLLYTIIVVFNVVTSNGPWIVVGAYTGGILHGLMAMLTQWTLREMALHMRDLNQAIREIHEPVSDYKS